MNRSLAYALVGALLVARPGHAQRSSRDSLEIAAAAARAIVSTLPKGTIVFDEAPLVDYGTTLPSRPAAQNRVIVRALGAARASRADAHVVCTTTSRGPQCKVRDTDAFVSMMVPVIMGDSATVTIRTYTPSHDGVFSMYESDHIVTLRRSGGRWKAVSTFRSRIT